MVLAAQHLTQGSLDGVTAVLRAGPVTELDLKWLFGVVDDRPAVVELRPGELAAAVARHDAIADPGARDADRELLGCDLVSEPPTGGARAALLRVLG
jgi:hypothetical protein